MVDEILTAAGVNHKETRFLSPQTGTYAVWFDEMTTRGADNILLIEEHVCSIEVYAAKIDRTTEAKIEEQLAYRAIPYTKSDHYWLDTEQLFQTIYTFDFTKKKGR